MVDPHAGGSAQRASEGRALLLRLIDHTAVPGRRLGASAEVSHSLARDDRLEVHVGKGKEVALRASFRPLPHAAGRVALVTLRGKEEQGRRAGAIEGWYEYGGCCPTIDGSREAAVLTR